MLFGLRALVGGLLTALMLAGPATAEWRRAESDRFIVYSQGSESALRRYVRTLEVYDYILRARMRLPIGVPPARKLPIYLVSGHSGLVQINPRVGSYSAGQYFPAGEDIFAAAISDSDQDYLLHEYFHHFSLESGAAVGLPGWLMEGSAEYFMTARVTEDTVQIGRYNEDRVYSLFNASWLPLDQLLGKRFSEVRSDHRETYYPLAWLLTHYMMSDDARRAQLGAYIADVRAGADPAEAMERATGMSLRELRGALLGYRRLPISVYKGEFPEPQIAVTELPRSADDLLLLGQRLKVGVAEDQRASTAAQIRRLAARHPDDPFAMLQLGHAELHFGNPDAGEAVLARLLEMEPDNIEALQLMASRYSRLAEERPTDAIPMLARARTYLAKAFAADQGHYYTLWMLARTRQVASGYPSANDLTTWDLAYQAAPQLAGIRLGYASAMMQAGEFENAAALLVPLASAPHGGPAADTARTLLERARAGLPPLGDDELAAAAEGSDRPSEPGPQPEAGAARPEGEAPSGDSTGRPPSAPGI
ncbi:MAG: tetratricopeptide repeat protein [Brevundimonas sp.]